LKVLKVSNNDPVLYQRALLTSELKGIYKGAPPDPVLLVKKNDLGTSVVQCPIKGECPICYELLTDNVVWCKSGCGSNIHTFCFEKWITRWVGFEKVNCPLCESPWVCEHETCNTPQGCILQDDCKNEIITKSHGPSTTTKKRQQKR